MSVHPYAAQLQQAIDCALKTGGFDKRNVIEQAEHVCIYGLGRFFTEAFVPWQLQKRFRITHLCDRDPKKLREVAAATHLKAVTMDALKTMKNTVVIVMLGDPIPVQRELRRASIETVGASELFFTLIADLPRDPLWFEAQAADLRQALECLSDDESRRIFVNDLCNRIAPPLAEFFYDELYSVGEYFSHGLYALSPEEAFVDCGAYTGDTVERFLSAVDMRCAAVHAFEMHAGNFSRLKQYVSRLPAALQSKINCVNAGVWNENGSISYGKEAHGSNESFSVLKTQNALTSRVVTLDCALRDKPVTLLKMDIEGAEQNALRGAATLIRTRQPKLAVCLYHRLDAYWQIPLYLKALVPSYKLAVRHHSNTMCGGTVLYAYN